MHFFAIVDRGTDGLNPPNTSAAVNGSDTYANVPLHIIVRGTDRHRPCCTGLGGPTKCSPPWEVAGWKRGEMKRKEERERGRNRKKTSEFIKRFHAPTSRAPSALLWLKTQRGNQQVHSQDYDSVGCNEALEKCFVCSLISFSFNHSYMWSCEISNRIRSSNARGRGEILVLHVRSTRARASRLDGCGGDISVSSIFSSFPPLFQWVPFFGWVSFIPRMGPFDLVITNVWICHASNAESF